MIVTSPETALRLLRTACDCAKTRLYDCECHLRAMRQTKEPAWIAAAYKMLHQAVEAEDAACWDLVDLKSAIVGGTKTGAHSHDWCDWHHIDDDTVDHLTEIRWCEYCGLIQGHQLMETDAGRVAVAQVDGCRATTMIAARLSGTCAEQKVL